VSDGAITRIRIPVRLWARLLRDLRRKGNGRRESGAFLLGREGKNPARVTAYLCYDDLDSGAYQGGAIQFHAAGYAALWQECKEKQLQVLADAHTHPGSGVCQSPIDQRHPMVPVLGHTAMIVPNFGSMGWWSLKTIGIYEYLGNFQWRVHPPSPSRRVKLSL
jgi:Prokaryotic homologs of the JAB domain